MTTPMTRGYSKTLMATVVVEPVVDASDEVVAACHRLIPQLSSSSRPITIGELAEIVEGDSTVLFAARSDGEIVGLLTLAIFRIPTAVRAWIEDVVVDERARGKGVGEALNQAALAEAKRPDRLGVYLDVLGDPKAPLASRWAAAAFAVRTVREARATPATLSAFETLAPDLDPARLADAINTARVKALSEGFRLAPSGR